MCHPLTWVTFNPGNDDAYILIDVVQVEKSHCNIDYQVVTCDSGKQKNGATRKNARLNLRAKHKIHKDSQTAQEGTQKYWGANELMNTNILLSKY